MRKLLSLFLLVFISIQFSQSQVPQGFNYQAVLRDASGNPSVEVNVAVITSLLQGTFDGTVVFAETHTGTTNEHGLINLQIGSINASGFSEIDWTGGPYFLNINVNGTDLGTSQLLSNPFALVAEDVINKDDADANPANEIQTLSISNDTISLSDGGEIKLPSPENIQTLSVSEYGDTLYISEGNFVIIPGISAPNYNLRDETITDFDGNEYKVVMIGDQIWMAENLKSIHYSDGIPLIDGTGVGDIAGNYITKYYFSYADNESNVQTWGRLYTWAAAMNGAISSDNNPSDVQGVCPDGWHLPSDLEWKDLEIALGMKWDQIDITGPRGDDEGGMLKEAGTTHWITPNSGASNSSQFTALPAGYRLNDSRYSQLGYTSWFWSTSEDESFTVWFRDLTYNDSNIDRNAVNKDYGVSVRCVKNK